jgi:MFS family permease
MAGGAAGAAHDHPIRAMVSAVSTMAAALLPSFLAGAVGVPMGEELGFSEGGLGIAVAVFFLLAAITSPPAGALTDRLGPRRSLRIASLFSGLSLLATAAFVHSLAGLLVTMVVGAIGLTIAGPGTKVMVARGVPVRRHGVAFGIQAGAVPLSSFLCGVAVSTIVVSVGWRWAYVAAVAVPLLGFLLAPAVVPAVPRDAPGADPAVGRVRPVIDYGPLVALGLAVVLGGAAATSVAAFFVPAATAIDIDEGIAGVLLAVGSVAVIAVRIAAGAVADRTSRDPLSTVMAMMALSTAGYALAASTNVVLMPLGALLALGAGWSWSGLVVHAVVRHYADTPGAATGIISGAQNVGGVVGPLTFGFLAEHVSYASAFLVVAASALTASFAASAGRRKLTAAATTSAATPSPA